MQIEYEATFPNINKDEVREKLKSVGAKLIKPEFMQKRVVFNLPKGHEVYGAWMRVRDEGDKITMSYKIVDNRQDRKIENQKEICLTVNSFADAEEILNSIGCEKKSYQESRREMWDLDGVEIDIDEWPFLEPYLEIESDGEERVKKVAEKLGFDYQKALFCSVDTLFKIKYGVPEEIINNSISEITFEGKNPFEK